MIELGWTLTKCLTLPMLAGFVVGLIVARWSHT